MEKIIYKGQDITEIIELKEKDIIKLYSQERKISLKQAERIYLESSLKKAIRDVDNDLWTQSEYYIIEAYASYLDKVAKKELIRNKYKSRSKSLNDAFKEVSVIVNEPKVKKDWELPGLPKMPARIAGATTEILGRQTISKKEIVKLLEKGISMKRIESNKVPPIKRTKIKK